VGEGAGGVCVSIRVNGLGCSPVHIWAFFIYMRVASIPAGES
jgi:hypothetical protein